MAGEILIVGAGFAGAVMAERLAHAGHRVRVIDQREHIAGNAFDYYNNAGILVHQYGPHIFHTNAERVFDYLSNFTEWRFYQHRVRACVEGRLYPIPINKTTINQMYDLALQTEAEVAGFLAARCIMIDDIKTSEDVVLSTVGRELCDRFFRGYTRKQWGCDLSELSPSVVARIPVRYNDDDRYFTDTYQYMPAKGFTELFNQMLDHRNISLETKTAYNRFEHKRHFKHIVFTGPIDQFFDFCYGGLPYRSMRFEHQTIDGVNAFQLTGTVNYPNDHDYTRITEFKHLTGQDCPKTAIVKEFPTATGEPFYPVPFTDSQALYRRYWELAQRETSVSFVGRLAQYRYYNMDQVVAAALKKADDLIAGGL